MFAPPRAVPHWIGRLVPTAAMVRMQTKEEAGARSARPAMAVQWTTGRYVLEAVAVAAVLSGFAILVLAWSKLPERVPVHFSFGGQPDRWGGRIVLLVLPCIGMLIYLGLSLLARHPHTFNYPVRITEENALRQYRISVTMIVWLKTEVAILISGLLGMSIAVAVGHWERINPYATLGAIAAILLTVIFHIVWMFHVR